MKRRTLDLIFSIGGIVFAVLLLVLGLILKNQGNFAHDYVKDQLSEQNIKFPAEYNGGETDVEGSGCLTKFAGTVMDNGSKAECYANYFIKTHMKHSAEDAEKEGPLAGLTLPDGSKIADSTYASIGALQGKLREEAATATDKTAADAKLAAVNGLRESMFKGETLRGLLLTTYGFSIFGDRASTAATVAIIAAAVLALLSIAGLVHAFGSKRAGENVIHVDPAPTA